MNSQKDSRSEIGRLYLAGLTVREIALRVGKSHQWVSRVTHELDAPALTVSMNEDGSVNVRGEMDQKLLATRVVKALRRTSDVTYERDS